MGTRQRREARAARLAEWADKREAKATELYKAGEPYRGDIAFITQPGHDMQRLRDKVNAKADRAYEHSKKAEDMRSRSEGIQRQLDRSIYDDDPDAVERLTERIANLEAQRDQHKAENTAYRKEHAAELKAMTSYGRRMALPHPFSSNQAAEIRRNKQRLERLTGTTPATPERRDCPHCGSSDTRWFRRRFECWGCGKTFSEAEGVTA